MLEVPTLSTESTFTSITSFPGSSPPPPPLTQPPLLLVPVPETGPGNFPADVWHFAWQCFLRRVLPPQHTSLVCGVQSLSSVCGVQSPSSRLPSAVPFRTAAFSVVCYKPAFVKTQQPPPPPPPRLHPMPCCVVSVCGGQSSVTLMLNCVTVFSFQKPPPPQYCGGWVGGWGGGGREEKSDNVSGTVVIPLTLSLFILLTSRQASKGGVGGWGGGCLLCQ